MTHIYILHTDKWTNFYTPIYIYIYILQPDIIVVSLCNHMLIT